MKKGKGSFLFSFSGVWIDRKNKQLYFTSSLLPPTSLHPNTLDLGNWLVSFSVFGCCWEVWFGKYFVFFGVWMVTWKWKWKSWPQSWP